MYVQNEQHFSRLTALAACLLEWFCGGHGLNPASVEGSGVLEINGYAGQHSL